MCMTSGAKHAYGEEDICAWHQVIRMHMVMRKLCDNIIIGKLLKNVEKLDQ